MSIQEKRALFSVVTGLRYYLLPILSMSLENFSLDLLIVKT
jgi:hypothetical protein